MASVTTVNSLALPVLLLELIERNRWRAPNNHRGFEKLFTEYSDVTFYSPFQMEKETSWWLSLSDDGSCLRGKPDSNYAPGDIEGSLTVLIGDIGMGFDAPFALDYRTSSLNPRVIHYRWNENNELIRWLEIAPDFQSFVHILNL
jgi:hypothetical protein